MMIHRDGKDGSLYYCSDAKPLITNKWFGYCPHTGHLVNTHEAKN
jgi:hypothetical protein